MQCEKPMLCILMKMCVGIYTYSESEQYTHLNLKFLLEFYSCLRNGSLVDKHGMVYNGPK